MAKYRKKPIVIEATQWDPDSLTEQPKPHTPDRLGVIWQYGPTGQVASGIVTTIHGQETKVAIGDWIIKEPDEIHHYPCKPDIFEATYEKVE